MAGSRAVHSSHYNALLPTHALATHALPTPAPNNHARQQMNYEVKFERYSDVGEALEVGEGEDKVKVRLMMAVEASVRGSMSVCLRPFLRP